DDAAVVGGLRDVAPRAAGHEDLYARLAVLFQQQHPPPEFGRANGRDQSGRPGADRHDIPGGLHRQPPGRSSSAAARVARSIAASHPGSSGGNGNVTPRELLTIAPSPPAQNAPRTSAAVPPCPP